MTDNTEQEKGLIDLMAEKQVEGEFQEYISTHLPKEKLIDIGTNLILEYILPELRDNPNLFMELNNGAWAISYDYKYGIIVSKGKGLGIKYIAYLLQHEDKKFEPIELMDQLKTTLNDKTSTGQYDVEEGDSIDAGIISDKLDPKAQKEILLKYDEIKVALGNVEILDDQDPEKIVLLPKIQDEKEKYEKSFLDTYDIPIYYLYGKHKNIPKDKLKNIESIKTMVIRDIRRALDLIGEDPNISPLKDYLERYITRSDKLIYTHDQTKPSWKVFLK